MNLSRSLRQASNERKILEGRERFIFETPKNKDFQIHPGWSTAWHKQYDSRAVRYPPQLYAWKNILIFKSSAREFSSYLHNLFFVSFCLYNLHSQVNFFLNIILHVNCFHAKVFVRFTNCYFFKYFQFSCFKLSLPIITVKITLPSTTISLFV